MPPREREDEDEDEDNSDRAEAEAEYESYVSEGCGTWRAAGTKSEEGVSCTRAVCPPSAAPPLPPRRPSDARREDGALRWKEGP